MSAVEAIASALLGLGALLLLIASIGVVRLPDVFMRMSATSKASSLGSALILAAAGAAAGDRGLWLRAIVGMAFLLLTAPVAAHMIGRAAYLRGARLWSGTICDDLRGRYDAHRHTLAGTGPRGKGREAGAADPKA